MSTSPPSPISIRPLQSWEEYLAAEEIQRAVWQMPDWRDAVPANLLVTAQKNGGLALGAFDGAQLVGLAFGFVGFDAHGHPPVLKHCSHMLAVLPAYQSRKIGMMLKLEQRLHALAQGLALMTWTYDPLQAINAHLNLARLGAIARRYVLDAYGEMTDGLNVGLASDRFEVEWWLESPRVQARLAGAAPRADWSQLVGAGAREVFEIARDASELPRIAREFELGGDVLLVQVPPEIGALKAAAPELARDWRSRTREVFTRAFAAGYAATDFVHVPGVEGSSRAAYVLTRSVQGL